MNRERKTGRGDGMSTDEQRLIVELASVYVACDDCGHSRVLRTSNLRMAGELGVHTYRDLCFKIRCGECPPALPEFRNLMIRPTWRCDELPFQTSA